MSIQIDKIKGPLSHKHKKYDVGLGNVDNTSDINKPVSIPQQNALDLKNPVFSADAPLRKPSADKIVLDIDANTLAVNAGLLKVKPDVYPALVNGKVPLINLPAAIPEVIEVANFAALPAVGESAKVYICIDTRLIYRWGGSVYAELSQSLGLGDTANSAGRGDHAKIAYDHVTDPYNPHQVTKAQTGLSNADNTSDINKPVSIDQAAADDLAVHKAGAETVTGSKTFTAPVLVETTNDIGLSVDSGYVAIEGRSSGDLDTNGITGYGISGISKDIPIQAASLRITGRKKKTFVARADSAHTPAVMVEAGYDIESVRVMVPTKESWGTSYEKTALIESVEYTDISLGNETLKKVGRITKNGNEDNVAFEISADGVYKGDSAQFTNVKNAPAVSALGLDADGNLTKSAPMAASVPEVIEVANVAALPAVGQASKIYVALDTRKIYRWGGSSYTELSESLALGDTANSAGRGDRAKMSYDHITDFNNPHHVPAVVITSIDQSVKVNGYDLSVPRPELELYANNETELIAAWAIAIASGKAARIYITNNIDFTANRQFIQAYGAPGIKLECVQNRYFHLSNYVIDFNNVTITRATFHTTGTDYFRVVGGIITLDSCGWICDSKDASQGGVHKRNIIVTGPITSNTAKIALRNTTHFTQTANDNNTALIQPFWIENQATFTAGGNLYIENIEMAAVSSFNRFSRVLITSTVAGCPAKVTGDESWFFAPAQELKGVGNIDASASILRTTAIDKVELTSIRAVPMSFILGCDQYGQLTTGQGIQVLTQAQYDALVTAGTVINTVLYFIKG
jgi:hypothetical protein